MIRPRFIDFVCAVGERLSFPPTGKDRKGGHRRGARLLERRVEGAARQKLVNEISTEVMQTVASPQIEASVYPVIELPS